MAKASCDRIIGMRDGRVVFDGTPDQLGHAQLCDIFGVDADVTVDHAAAMAMVSAA
jgi:phosphonate transport system ATP-binding protein